MPRSGIDKLKEIINGHGGSITMHELAKMAKKRGSTIPTRQSVRLKRQGEVTYSRELGDGTHGGGVTPSGGVVR